MKTYLCCITLQNDASLTKVMHFNDLFLPTQMLLCFCISILCVFVCACMCLCNFLGACLPVSLLVRARGMTGVGASPSYYRAFDFTTEAKWDSRCKKRAGQLKRGCMQCGCWLTTHTYTHMTVSLLVSLCLCE